MDIFKIEELNFSYPNTSENILSNININIKSGDFVVLCGKSGSGKTTLLKHFKSSLMPNGNRSGKILFKDTEVSTLDLKTQASEIGYVFQNPDNQIVCDKVLYEMSFVLENLGMSNKKIRMKVAEMASFFGINHWIDKSVFTLSGGQKQILNLASVMVMNPSVLILDEPTSQLDPINSMNFFDVLKKINRQFGTTIILCEHRLDEALYLADSVIVIKSGKILVQGKPKKVVAKLHELNDDMFLSMPSPSQIYYGVENNLEIPITVGEGVKWLNELLSLSNIKADSIESVSYKNTNTEKAIEVKNIWFKYEKDGKYIIKDLNFSVGKGEIYSILGGNGAGKTTTIDLISRAIKPIRGQIKINGVSHKNYLNDKDNKFAILPQNVQSIFSEDTVKKEIYEFVNQDECHIERIDTIIAEFDLTNLLDKHPYDLSVGEQQRLALAKIFILEPTIVILDEPTKGMDNYFKNKFYKILNKYIIGKGGSILIISHDIEFCARYSDRCALLFDGNIVSEDLAREFFAKNNFYTTCANRMTKHIFKNAIVDQDAIELCNKNLY